MKNFATGVTVVSTMVEGTYYGITVNSFTSVSLSPPMILFCLEKCANRYDSLIKSQYFTINILAEDQKDTSKLFSEFDIDQWQDKFIPSSDTEKNDKYILKGALSYLYTKVEAIYPAGDHDIISCQVIAMDILSTKLPLIYYNREYCSLIEKNYD